MEVAVNDVMKPYVDHKGSSTTLEQGKLYRCPRYYLLIYPSAEQAVTAAAAATAPGAPAVRASYVALCSCAEAMGAADYWSRRLDCQVRFATSEDIFMFLEETTIGDDTYLKFLFGEFQGWVIFTARSALEEVTNQ